MSVYEERRKKRKEKLERLLNQESQEVINKLREKIRHDNAIIDVCVDGRLLKSKWGDLDVEGWRVYKSDWTSVYPFTYATCKPQSWIKRLLIKIWS